MRWPSSANLLFQLSPLRALATLVVEEFFPGRTEHCDGDALWSTFEDLDFN